MNGRKDRILELLTKEKRINVNALSNLLGVSQVTIRKDLDSLEQTGMVKREHGFAILASENDILGRLAYHHEIKKQIALKAAELVDDNETIMIESGSCCAILAQVLCEKKKGLSIITNSAFIADYIRSYTDFEIVLLGGIYQHDSQAIVGPMVRLCCENFWVDKYFIGLDGYSPKIGFTNRDQLRAQAVRDMAHQAEHIIVVTESEKFNKPSNVPLNITNKVSFVITDKNMPADIHSQLAENNIVVEYCE